MGELYKLETLTECVVHDCIKKLPSDVDGAEQEEIESLCKVFVTVGQALDTSKAHGYMGRLLQSHGGAYEEQERVVLYAIYVTNDVIELRERKRATRNTVSAPWTITRRCALLLCYLISFVLIIHLGCEGGATGATQPGALGHVSRGPHSGDDRDGNAQVCSEDSEEWAVASGLSEPANKAGDPTNFGKIRKDSGAMHFGPTSVFTKKKESKRDCARLSKWILNTNTFQMLQTAEVAMRLLLLPCLVQIIRQVVDLTHNTPVEPSQPAQHPKFNLLPLSKPLLEKL